MKPKVLVLNTSYLPSSSCIPYRYKYNLYYIDEDIDMYSDNLRILLKIFKLRGTTGRLLGTSMDEYELVESYYYRKT